MILNLHAHLPAPKPEAVISCNPAELPAPDTCRGQKYSVGIHPWKVSPTGISASEQEDLHRAAARPDVVAIGETGIDKARLADAPLFAQILAFKAHILLSEELRMPMILHCVRAHDIIISLRKEMKATQRWIIHGFRGKPTILRMLLDAGIDVSYGDQFNAESVALTPPDRLFAETDEAMVPIEDVIRRLGEFNPGVTVESIAGNITELITPE